MIATSASSRPRIASAGSSRTFATATSAAGRGSESASTSRATTSTPLAAAFATVVSTATGSTSTQVIGRKPSRGRGDPEDARAAADVEQRPTSPELCEQFDAEPRRRVRTGAERATRVDDDGARRIGGRLPRRADPDSGHLDRPVERAPGVLPAVLDRFDGRARQARAHGLERVAVHEDGELDAVLDVPLLEALRRERDERGAGLLGAFSLASAP